MPMVRFENLCKKGCNQLTQLQQPPCASLIVTKMTTWWLIGLDWVTFLPLGRGWVRRRMKGNVIDNPNWTIRWDEWNIPKENYSAVTCRRRQWHPHAWKTGVHMQDTQVLQFSTAFFSITTNCLFLLMQPWNSHHSPRGLLAFQATGFWNFCFSCIFI